MLNKLAELVNDCKNRFYNVKTKSPTYPPIYTLISSVTNGKSFISTNFESNNIYFVRIQKFKVRLTIWNPKTGEIKIVKTRLTSQPKKLEIKKDGMELLRDYFSLLFKRPFMSLSAVNLTILPRMIPALLGSIFTGSFVHLEAGANLLAHKFSADGIDRNDMRELVSFADSCLLSQFRNPEKSIRQM